MRIPEACGPLTEVLREQLPSPPRELAAPVLDSSLDPGLVSGLVSSSASPIWSPLPLIPAFGNLNAGC